MPFPSNSNFPTREPNALDDISAQPDPDLTRSAALCSLLLLLLPAHICPASLPSYTSTPHPSPCPVSALALSPAGHTHRTCSSHTQPSQRIICCTAALIVQLVNSSARDFICHKDSGTRGNPRCLLTRIRASILLSCPQECLPWLCPGLLRPCLDTLTLKWTRFTPPRGIFAFSLLSWEVHFCSFRVSNLS